MTGFSFYPYALWLTFSLCLAMTVLGLLSLVRMSGRNQYTGLHWLQYAWVMLMVFGFYGVWSRILIPALLDPELSSSITPFVSGLALPFLMLGQLLMLAWLFLLRQRPLAVPLAVMATGWVVAVSLVKVIDWQSGDFFSLLTLGTGLVFILTGLVSVLAPSFPMPGRAAMVFAAGIAGSALFYTGNAFEVSQAGLPQLGLVLLYFLSHTLILVSYLYLGGTSVEPVSFEDLLKKFQVTPREAQVVMGIFEGKTNQEIADSLFISLQTVKDHTSRIYQKVQVRNRTQLVAMLREAITSEQSLSSV